MTYSVVNTSDWTFEKLAPYTRDISVALKKLEDRFPQDVTARSMAQEVIQGQQVLWLVLDGDAFVAVCLTRIRTIEATGTKILTLTSHAGEEGQSCIPEMCRVIEAYATEQGCDWTAAEGRRGWGRAAKAAGYSEYAVIWRKKLERAA